MKQKSIEIFTFVLFLLPLLLILASPTFSSYALGLDEPVVRSAAGPIASTFYGMGGMYDGWILESGEFTGVGGSMNAAQTTIPLGDAVQDRQYRGIITFDTSGLPLGSDILTATIYLRANGVLGINPFNFGDLRADIKSGYFGTAKSLQLIDFASAASFLNAGNQTFCAATGACRVALAYSSLTHINTSGFTQFRLRFIPDDNDNLSPDYYRIYSGDTSTLSYKPLLVVRYYP